MARSWQSQVARGTVWHRRFTPRAHAFRYGVSMLKLRLGEANEVFRGRWLWSWNRPNVACILRRDHLRVPGADLEGAVRDLIHTQRGVQPTGPIDLLTQPRYAGYVINPISLYLVWDAAEAHLEWIVLEVHNTPWNQQVLYVLQVPDTQVDGFTLRFSKEMHVSPFMPMDMEYELTLRVRTDALALRLDNWREGQRVFSANMALSLEPVTAWRLARTLLVTPLMTLQVLVAIHYQALRLYLKGVPYIPPPSSVSPAVRGPDQHL